VRTYESSMSEGHIRLETKKTDGSKSEYSANICKQVDTGFKRRNENFIREVYDKHKSGNKLTGVSLELALKDFGIDFRSTEITKAYELRFLTKDEGLGFEEFSHLVSTPSPIEMWISALHLNQLIADAMPRNDVCGNSDPLRELSGMAPHQLKESCEVIMEKLNLILLKELDILKTAYARLDSQEAAENNHKFQICTMNVGNIKDFHNGLAARVGKLPLLSDQHYFLTQCFYRRTTSRFFEGHGE
jgi:hypothetical protein